MLRVTTKIPTAEHLENFSKNHQWNFICIIIFLVNRDDHLLENFVIKLPEALELDINNFINENNGDETQFEAQNSGKRIVRHKWE